MATIDKFFVQGILLLIGHHSNRQNIFISTGMLIFYLPDTVTLHEVAFLPVKARIQSCQFIKEVKEIAS
jgi:hypothetical protein